MKVRLLTLMSLLFCSTFLFAQKPNIVVITTDDVAPMDISAYHRGLGAVETPNIDRIAKEGMMISDFYAHPSCTAGRAAFITGQYPIRTGLTSVGQPGSHLGMQAEDVTLAELLKDKGYATAQFGKSHVGDRNEHLPTVHGFDEFFGVLYHLNMMNMPEQPEFPKDPNYPGLPRNVLYTKASDVDDSTVDPRFGKVGKQTIEDRGTLYAKRQETFDDEVLDISIDWLDRTKKEGDPFFLWFCPTRMHQEIFVSDEWAGKSGHGKYADGLMHMDYLIGELLNKLDEMGVADNTILLFTSDNGVNLSHWPSAGTASFRGEKGTTWDGGLRVPMLVRWPGKIEAGQHTGEFMTAEDWLPTLMAAIGEEDIKEELLEGKKVNGKEYKVHIDGYNQMDMLTGKGKTKRREFFYFGENDLNAIRVDNWKIHLAVKDEWIKASEKIPAGMIIDIKLDPYERTPETKGHFLWMKEKTWILPMITPPVREFVKSLEAFPPRQKGAGIGAAAIMNQIEKAGAGE
ncbi:arylsulfatase [Carboxylicivirga sp. M1479]|uniref:arylsulfatase n=1 Tax=Carboxylicivirga sp. M1479 TaxID=2594476 RepID=UPI001177FBAF|nr:arylsulfatase [Carboxylicivirga sp. M1479]TRX66170.1 arylsulfatase [Carboxylicivirga sp. M1479]